MKKPAIAIVGTFDSKGEEHLFLKSCIEERGLPTLTVNVGTKKPSAFPVDIDLYPKVKRTLRGNSGDRDKAIETAISHGREVIRDRYDRGEIAGMISAGGGTGTHLGTSIMRVLPLGVPKVMISTVASRNMAKTVGTRDITMMHSVVDLLGVNSISGILLEKAAAAVCGMVRTHWKPKARKKRIALTFFGFITKGAEEIKRSLEAMDYEVVSFHANGTGGMAMEELAREGYFEGILDFAIHELADELMGGYCRGIGPERLEPPTLRPVPRLVVPGGMDCAVLEFTRDTVPYEHRNRKLFFYDFRSAIRLNKKETATLAKQVAEKLKIDPSRVKVLVPKRGFSEADQASGPLFDPAMNNFFVRKLKRELNPMLEIREADYHINDGAFARLAAEMMDAMVRANERKEGS
ncbi:MAG: Tm-1-like ATP-binding domain-containing protein [Deltaproteobacteria bacterium]